MTEPILGWRKWRTDSADGLLRSLFKDTIWIPGRKVEAKCLFRSGMLFQVGRQCSHAPTWNCTCGVYAVNQKDELDRVTDRNLGTVNADLVRMLVTGRVNTWGKTIEYDHGVRAQFAYPYDLFVHPPLHSSEQEDQAFTIAHRTARLLREHYLVDAEVTP